MKTISKLALTIPVLILAPIVLMVGLLVFENYKPTHWLDPTTNYIRDRSYGQKYAALVPDLFEAGDRRDLVERRLAASGFQSAVGTPFALRTNTGEEMWFRRDQFLALWHFNVLLRFDDMDHLISGKGMVAGPTFK